jgi:hypothetical protein
MSKVAGTGSIMGYTPTYAPLEQIHSTGTDPRSDLYSLAATLYHLITGATPPDALARASAVIGGQPDPLRPAHEINPQVPPAVSAALAHAMALHSEQRPATAAEMRRELSEVSRSPVLTGKSDMATVVVPPGDSLSTVKQSTQVQDAAAVTVVDAPGDSRPHGTPPPPVSAHTQAGAESRQTTPMHSERIAPAVMTEPGQRASRRPLVIGGVVVAALLVAGIVFALIAANNNGSPDPGSNKAVAQESPAGNVNDQTRPQAAPQSGKSESGGAASQNPKPEPTLQGKKKVEVRTSNSDSSPTPVRDTIKARVKARREY